jgi:hypothetical protein
MNIALRLVLTLFCVIAAFYFVFWTSGAVASGFLSDVGTMVLSYAVAVGAAGVVGRYAWIGMRESQAGLLSAIAKGALITGSVCFLAGFFGPIILTPEANQGPLLGLFITGPLGFLIGAIGGGIYWTAIKRRSGRDRQRNSK